MTPLRQKMIRAMELRNLAEKTQRYYLSSVIGLCNYYQQSPDKLTQEMIEDYLLYLKNDKGNTPGSCATVVAGLRFFYNHVADQQVPIDYRFSNKGRKLPTVLTQEQVWRIINAPNNIKHRLVLMTTYSAGLRAFEVTALRPEHIESEKMLINVERGKGGKQRYTILSKRLLKELRRYYKIYKPQNYLFPSSYKHRKTSPLLTHQCEASMRRLGKKPESRKASASIL